MIKQRRSQSALLPRFHTGSARVQVYRNGKYGCQNLQSKTRDVRNSLLEAATHICRILEEPEFCVIDGIALQRWGEPRTTNDIDISTFVGFGEEAEAVKALLRHFKPRFKDTVEFSQANRIALLKTNDDIGIDVSLGALPYEERVIGRSTWWNVPEHGQIKTCSAEDLITLKAFASRPQDWIDIEGVIIRQGRALDQTLIMKELTPLVELKEEPEILDQLQLLFHKHLV